MQRPEEDIGCPALSLPTLFKTGPLHEARAGLVVTNPKILLFSTPPPAWRFKTHVALHRFSHGVLGSKLRSSCCVASALTYSARSPAENWFPSIFWSFLWSQKSSGCWLLWWNILAFCWQLSLLPFRSLLWEAKTQVFVVFNNVVLDTDIDGECLLSSQRRNPGQACSFHASTSTTTARPVGETSP